MLPPLVAVEEVILAAEIVTITGAFTLSFLHPGKKISEKIIKNGRQILRVIFIASNIKKHIDKVRKYFIFK
jgi:heterodisulfide reductase subunit C